MRNIIIITLVNLFIEYLTFSFIELQLNPYQWPTEVRIFYIVIAFAIGWFVGLIYSDK